MKRQTIYLIGAGFILVAVMLAGMLLLTSDRNEVPYGHSFRDITISVPEMPVFKQTGGIATIEYRIVTSRFEDDDITLVKVDILDEKTGNVMMTLEKEGLQAVYHPATGEDTYPEIAITLTSEPTLIPKSVLHRLTFTSQGRAVLPFSVTGGTADIPRD